MAAGGDKGCTCFCSFFLFAPCREKRCLYAQRSGLCRVSITRTVEVKARRRKVGRSREKCEVEWADGLTGILPRTTEMCTCRKGPTHKYL